MLGQQEIVDVNAELLGDQILKVSKAGYEFIPQQQRFSNRIRTIFDDNPTEDGIYTIHENGESLRNISFNHPRDESILEYLDLENEGASNVHDNVASLHQQLKAESSISAYWKWFVILALLLAPPGSNHSKIRCMNILLKSAKIVCSENQGLHLKKRDILIKNGIIEKIAASIDVPSSTKLVDLKNLHVSLGWLDTSVSFGEPGYEERETISNGLSVASKSGFTDIILNPNTKPLPDSSSNIVFLKERSLGMATNLHPMGTLTKNGDGKDLAELFDMGNAGATAFYDFKQQLSNPNLLKIALLYAQNLMVW